MTVQQQNWKTLTLDILAKNKQTQMNKINLTNKCSIAIRAD